MTRPTGHLVAATERPLGHQFKPHPDAAQIPTKTNKVIPAREIIILWRVPKKTPSSKIQHRRMEKPALMRERQTER